MPEMGKIRSRVEVLRRLDVDVENGVCNWRPRDEHSKFDAYWNRKHAGKRAGGLNSQGYRVINMNETHHREHHLIWLVVYGRWPTEIDHIDGDRTNNRISNLREVSRSENRKNVGLTTQNKTGVPGVIEYSYGWVARVSLRGKTHHLGTFKTFDEAVAARRAAEPIFGYHANHGKREAHRG
jgi:hypothetical protein